MVLPIRKVLTSLGKIAKQLRSCEQIVAKNGQALTKGQKLVNTVFNVADKAVNPVLMGSLGMVGVSIIPLARGVNTENQKLAEQGCWGIVKGLDTTVGGVLGLALGGPIGALVGAGFAYSTDYSILGSLLAISEDFTIEDGHTDMARMRQITYDSVKELLGFNKSEEVSPASDNNESSYEVSEEQKRLVEEFYEEFEKFQTEGEVWTALKVPGTEPIIVHCGDETFALMPNDLIVKTETGVNFVQNPENDSVEIVIEKVKFGCVLQDFLENKEKGSMISVPDLEGFKFSFNIDEETTVTLNANDILLKEDEGQFVVFKPNNEGYSAIKAVFDFDNDFKDFVKNAQVGDTITVPVDTPPHCNGLIDNDGNPLEIAANDKIIKTEDGFYLDKAQKDDAAKISFRRLGKGAQPLELGVGERYIAEENMKFLVGRNNNLVSVNLGDTLVCKSDSTLDVRHFVPQVQKVSIRKIGTPTPVEYEVGKTYTADKEIRLLVGTNNQIVTIKADQNFKVNADKTVSIVNGN